MKKAWIILVLMVWSLLAVSCVSVKAPEGYAEQKEPWSYKFKAVSTDACVMTLKKIHNEDPRNGTVSYWYRAMKRHLVDARGYELKEEGEFSTARGPGRWMLFAYKVKGVDYLYLVGVVVKKNNIYVLESAGETAYLEKDLPALKKAFETLE